MVRFVPSPHRRSGSLCGCIRPATADARTIPGTDQRVSMPIGGSPTASRRAKSTARADILQRAGAFPSPPLEERAGRGGRPLALPRQDRDLVTGAFGLRQTARQRLVPVPPLQGSSPPHPSPRERTRKGRGHAGRAWRRSTPVPSPTPDSPLPAELFPGDTRLAALAASAVATVGRAADSVDFAVFAGSGHNRSALAARSRFPAAPPPDSDATGGSKTAAPGCPPTPSSAPGPSRAAVAVADRARNRPTQRKHAPVGKRNPGKSPPADAGDGI